MECGHSLALNGGGKTCVLAGVSSFRLSVVSIVPNSCGFFFPFLFSREDETELIQMGWDGAFMTYEYGRWGDPRSDDSPYFSLISYLLPSFLTYIVQVIAMLWISKWAVRNAVL
ncbi:hypothetical protein GQ43DRAFT_19737 [Delitschia confertaspora ATCC 74209]|uniref:Uncharacterized protein n=1 Tax=Delitschia confertaspora ATCC 74209 TaxID=1513339 RepID=A0A9P4MZF1_9PLEO|nr:hypothetical protein GQ43DRAFT_19737 [Delitschia confertaspora ATCC 74209]